MASVRLSIDPELNRVIEFLTAAQAAHEIDERTLRILVDAIKANISQYITRAPDQGDA